LAVRIRLRRTGAKGQASYRIVVADSHSPRDGRFLENIGHYNPRMDPPAMEINEERARYWLGQGAQPSDAVARVLEKKGLIAARKLSYNTPKGSKTEKAAKTEKPAAEGA
jgi:small subunit ribosomal protein S16